MKTLIVIHDRDGKFMAAKHILDDLFELDLAIKPPLTEADIRRKTDYGVQIEQMFYQLGKQAYFSARLIPDATITVWRAKQLDSVSGESACKGELIDDLDKLKE